LREYVYDSGALIAIDRSRDAEQVDDHKKRLAEGDHIIVPAPVAAQVVRDPRRQARLMLTLRGCEIVPFEEDDVFPVGTLLASSGTSDVVDGLVAVMAVKASAAVVTSDPDDIAHLLATLGVRLPVLRP
jgi:predicted nucleic acid-binding protein